ncbi:MAG: hypothetical protein ACRDBG_04490 [Waterburya sp.]
MEDRFLLLQIVRSIENTTGYLPKSNFPAVIETVEGTFIAKSGKDLAEEFQLSRQKIHKLIGQLIELGAIAKVTRFAKKVYDSTNYYLIDRSAVEKELIEPLKKLSTELQNYLGE